jgi:hypothetical protein
LFFQTLEILLYPKFIVHRLYGDNILAFLRVFRDLGFLVLLLRREAEDVADL